MKLAMKGEVKRALVTGAAHGLGAAIARTLAGAGYVVGVCDHDGAAAERTAQSMPNAAAIVADVTDAASVERAFAQFGAAPDLVVCNAGIVRFGPLLEQSLTDLRLVLDVNLWGAMLVALAIECGPLGVRVNAVSPGFIDAGMSAPIFANDVVRARRVAGVPLRRLGTAEDVANAVLWLDSPGAAYVSGHELVVDGGVVSSLLAQLPRA